MADRKDRLESLLKREVATVVQTRLRDPRIGFVTITRVSLSGDLQTATAYFTVLGSAKERKLAQQALDRSRGFVQSAYASVVRMRTLPQLRFAFDEQEERRARMDELISRARSTDPDHELPVAGLADPADD